MPSLPGIPSISLCPIVSPHYVLDALVLVALALVGVKDASPTKSTSFARTVETKILANFMPEIVFLAWADIRVVGL